MTNGQRLTKSSAKAFTYLKYLWRYNVVLETIDPVTNSIISSTSI